MAIGSGFLWVGALGSLLALQGCGGDGNAAAEGAASSGSGGAGGASSSAAGPGASSASSSTSSVSSGAGGGSLCQGNPITAPQNQWSWVPFPNTQCGYGTPAGIGINPASTGDKLL